MDDIDDFEIDQLLAKAFHTVRIQRTKASRNREGLSSIKSNLRRSLSASDLSECKLKHDFKINHKKERKTDERIVKPDITTSLNTKSKVDNFLKALSETETGENIDRTLYKYFVTDYNRNRLELSVELFKFFNQYVFENKLPLNIRLEWNSRCTTSAGYWKSTFLSKNSLECPGTILLSRPLLDTPEKLRDTLIHEMCHAATSIITKERDVHGPFWRYWTMRANLEFPSLPKITRCHEYKSRS